MLSGFKRWATRVHPWFQKSADKISAMKLPPDVAKLFRSISAALPEELLAGFIKYVGRVYKKHGKEYVAALIKNLAQSLKNI